MKLRRQALKRREFIKLIGGAGAAWPLAARAQRPTMPVVGYLSANTSSGDARPVAAFIQGLGQTGYEDGKTVKIEYRWADGQYDRLPSMAADLVRDQVAVIAALGTPAVRVAKAATATIPITFTTIADPVQIGFVTSLSRPGGNLTGVTLLAVEVGPKLLEILRGVVPSVTIIALLVNPTNPNSQMQSKNTQEAAHRLGLELHVLNASVESDFDKVFTKLRELNASALIIAQDVFFNAESARLAALTVRHAIPAIYPLPEFAAAGGLFSYGASRSDAWRQVGVYVGRILKGEKPAELPVVQPTKFELTINLKTAKALGLTVPTSLLASADEVIE
jgi:putative tryptophan/tyrosine transport system substrate-binding protein